MPDVSIAISAKDNFSSTITTIRNSNQAFDKDLEKTSRGIDSFLKKQSALSDMKKKMQTDLDDASNALRKARRAFAETNDEANRTNLEKAHENYNKVASDLKNLNNEAKQTQKSIKELSKEQSKQDNKASRSVSQKGIMSRLAGVGLGKMVGNSLSDAANVLATSKFGSEGGNIFGSMLSGVTTGAAIGSIVPGIGTAVGAGVGAVSGAISAATKTFENQDNAFKNAVQTEYNDITQSQKDVLSRGSAIASQRETDKLSFTTMLGGSKHADKFLSETIDFAGRTPFEYDDLTKISKTMLAYGYKQDEIFSQLTKIGDTGSALGMSTEDMNFVATSLGRMKSTGKTTMEYLNMLMERGIPAVDYLAEASGRSKGQIVEMVSKGLIPGAEAAKIIADYMGKANEGSMELQSKSYAGLQSSLEDAQKNVDSAMGEGYNEERKPGIQAQIDWLEGKSGKNVQEANKVIGKYKASLENAHEKAIRDATNSAMEGNDYKQAKAADNGAKMGEILSKTQADAEAKYRQSEGFQQEQQSQIDLVHGVQQALGPVYKTFGYNMEQEYSKGLRSMAQTDIERALHPGMAGVPNNHKSSGLVGMVGNTNNSKSSGLVGMVGKTNNSKPSGLVGMVGSGHATGINRVPYNNFPTLLHEGEKVSTAVEVRSQKGAPNITITGNEFNVRQESDIDNIASALVRKLQQAELVTP